MTKLLLSALVAISATTASAALSLKGRIDLNNTGYDDKARAAGNTPNWAVTPQKLDLGLTGNLSDAVSYSVTVALKKGMGSVGTRSDLNLAVTEARLTDKLNENLQLTLGKFFSNIGGWESQPSSADMYLYSLYGNFQFDYSGVRLDALFGDHTLEIHFAHPENQGSQPKVTFPTSTTVAVTTTSPYYDRTGAIAGIVYFGSFAEKSVNLMASYHMGKPNTKVSVGGSEKDVSETWTTLGVKYDADPVVVSLDYNMYANENASGLITSDGYTVSDQKNALTTIVLGAGYKMGNLMPKLHFVTESQENKPTGLTATKTAYTRIGLALEYTPNTEAQHRYHVAYTTESEKADTTGAETLTGTHLIIGTRFSADLLK